MKNTKQLQTTNTLIFSTLLISHLTGWNFSDGEKTGSLGLIGDSSGPNAVFITASKGLFIEYGLILLGLVIIGITTKRAFATYKGKKLLQHLGMVYTLPVLYLLLRIV